VKDDIGLENSYFWEGNEEKSGTCRGPTPTPQWWDLNEKGRVE